MENTLTLVIQEPRFEKDENFWIAHCDKMEISSCGKTKQEALTNLENSIRSYCFSLNEIGLLLSRLREKGIEYKIEESEPEPKVTMSEERYKKVLVTCGDPA